jgi:hypothetical protein
MEWESGAFEYPDRLAQKKGHMGGGEQERNCNTQCCGSGSAWIRIILKGTIQILIKVRIQIRIILKMTIQNVWNMSQFEHFVKVSSLYLEARIRILSGIKGEGRTRIRMRFRIKVIVL